MTKISVIVVKFYRIFISPLKPATCRFYPTCSAYTLESLEKYGFARGMLLSFKRVIKCHPFGGGGYDPVP